MAGNTTITGLNSHSLNFGINLLLTILSGYLLTALIYYEYTRTYWKNARSKESNNQIKKSKILRIYCIVGAKISFLHATTETAAPFVSEGNVCYALGIMWLLTYALGLLMTYIFLWHRQRWMYASPPLKFLRTRNVEILNWSTLTFLVLSAVTVFLAGSRMIFFSSCGENEDQSKHQLYTMVLSITLVTLTIIGQVQILVLFAIPLLSHEKRIRKSVRERSPSSQQENAASTTSASTIRRTSNSKQSNDVLALVKKCAILACVCMVIDLSAAILTIFLTRSAGKVVYDLNVFVSVLCCVLSFKNAKQMLFPFNRTRAKWLEKSDLVNRHVENVTEMQEVYSSN